MLNDVEESKPHKGYKMFKRYVFIQGLTNLVGSNGEFLINIEGQIKNIQGNDLDVRRDEQGHEVVHCRSWDGVRDYRVIDLVAIQFKSLQIPVKDYGKVIAFVLDGNKYNPHANNVGYRFEGGKLEVEGWPGFFYIPTATRMAIDEKGNLLDVNKGLLRDWHITKPTISKNIKGGYYRTTTWFAPGITMPIARHRALGMVFKEYPDNVDVMVVNHKDGIPGNDWLDNLEWMTRGENNVHAIVNDLKNQHDRVLSRDVLTGKVVEYYSIAECSRVLGYNTVSIWGRLTTSKFGKVFQDGKQFKLKDDPRDWIIPENLVADIKAAQECTPVLSRNCSTLEVIEHNSIGEAGRALEIERYSIMFRLSTDKRHPLFGYQFKHLDDPRPWVDFTKEEYVASLVPGKLSVSARNLLTGETKEFPSANKADLFFNNTTLSNRLKMGKQPLLDSGWQLKYSHHEWESIEDVEEAIYKLQRNIMAKHEQTGKCILADTARQLGAALGLNPLLIRQAALTRGNQVYEGYRFRLGTTNESWPTTVAANQLS